MFITIWNCTSTKWTTAEGRYTVVRYEGEIAPVTLWFEWWLRWVKLFDACRSSAQQTLGSQPHILDCCNTSRNSCFWRFLHPIDFFLTSSTSTPFWCCSFITTCTLELHVLWEIPNSQSNKIHSHQMLFTLYGKKFSFLWKWGHGIRMPSKASYSFIRNLETFLAFWVS